MENLNPLDMRKQLFLQTLSHGVPERIHQTQGLCALSKHSVTKPLPVKAKTKPDSLVKGKYGPAHSLVVTEKRS